MCDRFHVLGAVLSSVIGANPVFPSERTSTFGGSGVTESPPSAKSRSSRTWTVGAPTEDARSVFTFDESQGHATERSVSNRPRSEIVTSAEFHGEARREFRVVPESILNRPARRQGRLVPSPTMRQGYHLQRPSAVVPRTTASRPRSLGRARDRRSDPAVPLVLRRIAVAKAPSLIGRVKLTCLTTV